MKVLLLVLCLGVSWVTHGQIYNFNPTTSYFMDKVKIASNEDSKIEVRNRDTVLIARFEYINPQNQARQFSEKVYLGTPYWRNGWFTTHLELVNSKPIKGIMAFNLQQQKVYFTNTADKAAQEVKPDRFVLLGTTFTKGPDDRYYEILEESGPWKALKKFSCDYSPLKPAERSGYEISGGEFEGEFKKKVDYFLQCNEKIVRIRKGSKWTKDLGEHQMILDQWIKKSGGNLQSDLQVKSLVKHLGSLPKID